MFTSSKRPTIKEVAAAAGVSTQTVSRVVNARPDVSDETRQRVQRIIEELGYQPSALARSLIQQRSYTLGVVIAGLKFVGPSRTLNGITSAAENAGYSLLLKELPHFHANDIIPIIDALKARHVDGIIWAVPEIGENRSWVKEYFKEFSVPVLFLTMEPQDGIPCVCIDNFGGAVTAVQHLLEGGRKKIGHISGPMDWWEAKERKRGWEETLKSAGINVTEKNWTEGNWSSGSGVEAFEQLLKTFPDMDAVFVGNDQMALTILREACRRNIQIPDQLAVIGFDGIPESAYFYPSLSTISQDLQLIGTQAVQNLVEMIEAQQKNRPVTIQSKFIQPCLVVRESTKND